ncbi:MAG: hypothetical protein ACXW5U_09050 [Thermoanaerobaculia bacterium]
MSRCDKDAWVGAGVIVGSPTACSPYAEPEAIPVQSAQQPRFTTYGVYVGGSTEFDIILDPNTTSWNFENSLGDPMEIVGNPLPNVYRIRYTSTHGFGDSYIRIYGTTACGESFDTTGVMNVLPPPPTVTLTSAQRDVRNGAHGHVHGHGPVHRDVVGRPDGHDERIHDPPIHRRV